MERSSADATSSPACWRRPREVRDGHPRVVLLTGEPGIGKTALAHRFVSQAHGFQLWEASGEEAEQLLTFGVIEQLVRAAHSLGGPGARGPGNRDGEARDPIWVGAAPARAARHDAGGRARSCCSSTTPSGRIALRCRRSSSPCDGLQADRVLTLMVSRSGSPRGHLAGVPPPRRARPRRVGARPRPRRVVDPRPRGLDGGRSPLVSGRRPDSSSHRRQPAARDGDLRRDHPRDPSRAVRPAAAFDRRLRRAGALAARRVHCRRRGGWWVRRRCSGSRAASRSRAGSPSSSEMLVPLERAMSAHLLEERGAPADRLIAFPHPLVQAAAYHSLGPAHRAELHERAALLVTDEASALRHRVAARSRRRSPTRRRPDHLRHPGVARRGAWDAAADAHALGEPAHRRRAGARPADADGRGVHAARRRGRRRARAGRRDRAPSPHRAPRIRARQPGDDQRPLRQGAGPARRRVRRLRPGSRPSARRGDRGAARPGAHGTWPRRRCRALGDEVARRPPAPVTGRPIRCRCSRSVCSSPAARPRPQPRSPSLPRRRHSTTTPRSTASSVAATCACVTDDPAAAREDLAPVAERLRRRGPAHRAIEALTMLATAEYRMGDWDDASVHGQLAASLAEDADQTWLLAGAHAAACAPLAGRGEWEAATAHADAAHGAPPSSSAPSTPGSPRRRWRRAHRSRSRGPRVGDPFARAVAPTRRSWRDR